MQRHTYVIDHDYRIVYFDEAAKRLFPSAQEDGLCYKLFRNAGKPCEDCPWNPDQPDLAAQTLIFSPKRDQWYEIAAACSPCSGNPRPMMRCSSST
ncbi:MAG: hypothetical protein RR772_03685 [Gordonibacter sp.]